MVVDLVLGTRAWKVLGGALEVTGFLFPVVMARICILSYDVPVMIVM